MIAISPVFTGYTIWRSFRDGGRRYLCERLGLYPATVTEPYKYWIHAASVGEVLTVMPLIKALQTLQPGPVLLTTNTPTGAEVLARQELPSVTHHYLPVDFPGATRRFLTQIKADSVWITETEIWPWLFARCHQANVQITIISGRLSTKTSSQASGFLAGSYKHALQGVNVLARSEADRQAYLQLGASECATQTVGNLKYANATSEHQGRCLLDRPYVVAASTHSDEEIQLAREWMKLDTSTLLVIVPRHPERAEAILKSLQDDGFSCIRRSTGKEIAATHRIYLADTLGELSDWFAFAKGAFVGGSLIPRGGHNMLEPARFACPTIVGSHTGNFADIVEQMLQVQGIRTGRSARQIVEFLVSAADGSTELVAMAERARMIARKQENILQSYLDLLLGEHGVSPG